MFGIAKWILEHNAPQHIKLAAVAGFNGMVATVMYPGSRFIYKNIIINIYKKLYCKNAGAFKVSHYF